MCRSISFRLSLLALMVFVGPTSVRVAGSSAVDKTGGFETVHTSNAALLNRLGLSPLRIPQGHHKKRLAGPEPPPKTGPQSPHHSSYGRRHGGHGDSHVYVVKLPPSLPYYAITKPHKTIGANGEANFGGARNKGGSVKNYSPVGFHSNGKPGSIYHWNLPTMKKIAEKKRIAEERVQQRLMKKKKNESQGVSMPEEGGEEGEEENFTDLKTKRVRNNDKRLNYNAENHAAARDKNYRLDDSIVYKIKPGDKNKDHINRLVWNTLVNDPVQNSLYTSGSLMQRQKKHRKKSATSYYAPFAAKSGSTSMHKNFPGNGKPKAFYVIEKSRKPVYYHPLLP